MHNAATRRTSHTRRAASAAVAATITRRGSSRRFSSNIAMLGKTILSDEITDKSAWEEEDNNDDKDEEEKEEEVTPDGDTENETGAEPLLDSFDAHIVVSVLTATASFAALFETNSLDEGTTRSSSSYMSLLHNVSVLTCSICSLSGIYATVVFSLSSIYGRAAVGTGRMDIYEEFLKSTETIRYKAFVMYLLSLILFIVLLVGTATEKIDQEYRIYFFSFLLFLSIFSYNDWNTIIKCAGPIFTADEDTNIQSQQSQQQPSPGIKKKIIKTAHLSLQREDSSTFQALFKPHHRTE